MENLIPGAECEACAVRHHEGEDSLEGEGEKRVESEDEAVAVLADVARYLEAGIKTTFCGQNALEMLFIKRVPLLGEIEKMADASLQCWGSVTFSGRSDP